MKLNVDLLAVAVLVLSGLFYYTITLPSPVVFGDEGYYASLGRYMANTGEYPISEPYYNTDIYHYKFYKLPMFFLFNTGAWLIASELGIKLMMPIFSVLSALMMYVFLRSVGKPIQGLAAGVVLLMLPGMVTYGVMNYVETSNLLFVITALFLGYQALTFGKRDCAVISGVFTGLGALTDTTAFFIPAILFTWFLLSRSFGKWKELLIIFLVAGVILTPFLARNFLSYGGFCYNFLPGDCSPSSDITIPHDGALDAKFAGGVEQVGTNIGGTSFGVLNYFRFAYGWAAAILMLFGLSFVFLKFDKFNSLILVWFAFFIALTAQQLLMGGRTEDIPRYTLFGYPALAAISGTFIAEAFGWLEKKHVILGMVVLLLIGYSVWVFGNEKLTTMTSVKAFSAGFFDGCKWIRENTPQDTLIFSIYSHQTTYQCDRRNLNVLPDKAEIQLTNNNVSYQHLKLHGFDYIFVQQFAVSENANRESITTAFLNYLETSPEFKKVYDNTATYGSGGSRIYKVL